MFGTGAAPGAKVTVQLKGPRPAGDLVASASATAAPDGSWAVAMAAIGAMHSAVLSVSAGSATASIEDVDVGDGEGSPAG